MDTEKKYTPEHARYVRSLLKSGEQIEIAKETGRSYDYVRQVLMGKSYNPEIIRAAENKVLGRGQDLVVILKPILVARPDFAAFLKELINPQNTTLYYENN